MGFATTIVRQAGARPCHSSRQSQITSRQLSQIVGRISHEELCRIFHTPVVGLFVKPHRTTGCKEAKDNSPDLRSGRSSTILRAKDSIYNSFFPLKSQS
jgi:hypothetical protein